MAQVQGEQTEVQGEFARGKDGRLFLAGDKNDTLGQHAGERLLTDQQVQQWHDLLEARAAWLYLHGIPYVFFIAPDPHAVYAEMLPDGVVPGPTRPALQILKHLEECESWAPVMYPLSALQDERADEKVFPKTDTLWSGYGAYVAVRELMGRLTETLPVRRLTRREIRISDEQRAGDLGRESRFVDVEVIEPRARVVHDNGVRDHGRLVEFEGDSYNSLTCLVFGDSYAVRMVPVMAESFRRTIFAHTYFDYELVRELKPDIVVSVASERSLIEVQSDTGPGIRWLEREQQEAADVMDPRR